MCARNMDLSPFTSALLEDNELQSLTLRSEERTGSEGAGEPPTAGKDPPRSGRTYPSVWRGILVINRHRQYVGEEETKMGKKRKRKHGVGRANMCSPKAFSLSIKFNKLARKLAAAICAEPFAQSSPTSQQQPDDCLHMRASREKLHQCQRDNSWGCASRLKAVFMNAKSAPNEGKSMTKMVNRVDVPAIILIKFKPNKKILKIAFLMV